MKLVFVDKLGIMGDKYFFDTFQTQLDPNRLAEIKTVIETLKSHKDDIADAEEDPKIIHFDSFEDRMVKYLIGHSKYCSLDFSCLDKNLII